MSLKTVLEAQMTADQDIVRVTAAKTLRVDERFIHATANTATDSYAITLPGVAAAKGNQFSITVTIANSKVVTVQDQNDSEDWTDLTLDADEDAVVLYSTGIRWTILENAIA